MDRRHPFYLENGGLIDKLAQGIDEEAEASTRFTIFEDMIEGYLYLNKGDYQVSLISSSDDQNQSTFEVSTEEGSEVFRTSQANEWAELLNRL